MQSYGLQKKDKGDYGVWGGDLRFCTALDIFIADGGLISYEL